MGYWEGSVEGVVTLELDISVTEEEINSAEETLK